jgi:hypothetical protein
MALNNIVASTLEKYFTSGKATDNIFKRTAVLDFLNRRAKINTQGGRTAVIPIMGAANSTFVNYSGYDTFTPTADEILDTAIYNWKQSVIFVPMSGLEEAQNTGDKAVIKLVSQKTENAEMTAAETFEDMLFNATGTTQVAGKSWSTASGAKDWAGLASIVGTGAHAGITADYWESFVNATGGPLALTDLSHAYNTVSFGVDKCDFEVTTQELYERYEAILQANQRFTDANTAKAGFDNLLHKGGVVVWSDFCPDGEWYFLNSRHINLTTLSGNWMSWQGFIKPYNQDAEYGMVKSYGSFTTDGRRYLGKISGLTTAAP